jgi:hypothetical protein
MAPETRWLRLSEAVAVLTERGFSEAGAGAAILAYVSRRKGPIRLPSQPYIPRPRAAPLTWLTEPILDVHASTIIVPQRIRPGKFRRAPTIIEIPRRELIAASAREARPSALRHGPRYPGDAVLVQEGVKGIEAGQFSNAHQAAKALARRAEGQFDTSVDRLRKAIRKALDKHRKGTGKAPER